MTTSGLTILRNAVRLGYPFRESIRSGLPMCEEFVVVVGRSDDGTLEAVRELGDSRIRIIETEWSDRVRPRKGVLAQQTNVGLHACRGDWVLYLQANEVLHEHAAPALLSLMQRHRDDPRVEAFLFERLTFWGDYGNVVAAYPERFKFTPRVVRPGIGTYSIRDAMSFAVFDGFSMRGRYPRALDTGQFLHRYGCVCSAEEMAAKVIGVVHEMRYDRNHLHDDFFYSAFPRPFIRPFHGSHPAVMADRIRAFDGRLDLADPRWRTRLTLKEWTRLVETWFYERFGVPRLRNKRYALIGNYRKKPAVC